MPQAGSNGACRLPDGYNDMIDRRPSARSIALVFGAVAIAAIAASPGQSPPREQQPPAYRSGVTIVPLDVRVVDKNGRPITDLKQEDFRILENGVPQTIAHFVTQALVADRPQPALRASTRAEPFDPTPQNRRVFLIVLGPGALGDTRAHPETLNALLRFVRESLLPQDQVGLLAYNRALDFTTDHESVARLLEALGRPASGGPGALARRGSMAASDMPSVFSDLPAFDTPPSIEAGLGLEDYAKSRLGQSNGEMDALMAGINYLRYVGGEKHLVFVTERGPFPTWDQVKQLTSTASHARVAIDTIQTGGRIRNMDIPSDLPPSAAGPDLGLPTPRVLTLADRRIGGEGGPGNDHVSETPIGGGQIRAGAPIDGGLLGGGAPTTGNSLAGLGPMIYDLRHIAAQTGGQSSILKDGSDILDRIDTATRAQYLLAYYPTNGDWNGRYRSVKVEVNRPGATVLFRHGYFARREAEVFDRRRVVSNNRIESAGYQLNAVRDIDVEFTPRFVKSEKGKGGNVFLSVRVDTSRLAWGRDESGRHTASVEVAVYCGDGNQKIVGQVRRQLTIALTEATYQRASRDGFFRDMGIPVTVKPRNVKVIVYDYEADRVGSALVRIK
jgi:VWFA-related protein